MEARLIKKYPNRRLYDTTASTYITLEEIRHLIMENVTLQIVDVRTQADITHSTLLQIIIEQEEKGALLFTTDHLKQMIQFCGKSDWQQFHQAWIQSFLRQLQENEAFID